MLAPLRRWSKRAFARVAARILRPRAMARRPIPEKILVLRIDERVGNVLLTTPLLVALKEAFPRAHLEVLVAASKVKIVEGLAAPIRFEKRDFFARPWALIGLLWALRKRAFDVVIDASHWHHFSLSSSLLLGLVGAPIRITHDRGEAKRFATDPVAVPIAPEPEIRTKLRLLGPLGLAFEHRPMCTRLGTSPDAIAKIDEWIGASSAGDRSLVGLAPGSRKTDHRADPELFAGLGRLAVAHGAQPIVLWGPGEEALAEEVGRRAGALIAPPTDLEELAALMRRCRAVITNDTGPMHLAVACGAPTIALFRGADPLRWGHAEAPNAVISVEGRRQEEVAAEAASALESMLQKTRG